MELSLNCLDEHCKSVHKWKRFSCLVDDCKYVAHCKRTLMQHQTSMHTSRNKTYDAKEYQCKWKNCHSSFRYPSELHLHMNIHTNNLFKCSFCPYTCARESEMASHYRHHYKVFDFKCETCGKLFVTNNDRIRHIKLMHAFEMTTCPVCGKHGKKHSVHLHINQAHKLLSKWNKETQSFDVYKR